MNEDSFDIAIVGAGIVGLATALALRERNPRLRLAIVEKEAEAGLHQTSHNSGVVHSGVYYRPGSLKARLCVEGARRMLLFCETHGLPHERCGKVIVATRPSELPALDELFRRGTANGVPGLRLLGNDQLGEIEPHAAGIAALLSPATAIVDFHQVARAMARDLRERDVAIVTGTEVRQIGADESGLTLEGEQTIRARFLVNCAGLYSDVVARHMGVETDLRIVPFRGEYYALRADRRFLVKNLIYPVPDPELPFLGVHFTRTVHGEVEAGPNAVLAFAREGYSLRDVRVAELLATALYPGFWRMARRWWRTGVYELYRSVSKAEFTRALQRLIPEIVEDDLTHGGTGVRAQAVEPDGRLADDFAIHQSPRALHVLNAPSPAATASLAIGEYVAGLVHRALDVLSKTWFLAK